MEGRQGYTFNLPLKATAIQTSVSGGRGRVERDVEWISSHNRGLAAGLQCGKCAVSDTVGPLLGGRGAQCVLETQAAGGSISA